MKKTEISCPETISIGKSNKNVGNPNVPIYFTNPTALNSMGVSEVIVENIPSEIASIEFGYTYKISKSNEGIALNITMTSGDTCVHYMSSKVFLEHISNGDISIVNKMLDATGWKFFQNKTSVALAKEGTTRYKQLVNAVNKYAQYSENANNYTTYPGSVFKDKGRYFVYLGELYGASINSKNESLLNKLSNKHMILEITPCEVNDVDYLFKDLSNAYKPITNGYKGLLPTTIKPLNSRRYGDLYSTIGKEDLELLLENLFNLRKDAKSIVYETAADKPLRRGLSKVAPEMRFKYMLNFWARSKDTYVDYTFDTYDSVLMYGFKTTYNGFYSTTEISLGVGQHNPVSLLGYAGIGN